MGAAHRIVGDVGAVQIAVEAGGEARIEIDDEEMFEANE